MAEAPSMDTSEGMEVERSVREISALLECLGVGVEKVGIMVVFCLGRTREFASLFGIVCGGAFYKRRGWDSPSRSLSAIRVGLAKVCGVLSGELEGFSRYHETLDEVVW